MRKKKGVTHYRPIRRPLFQEKRTKESKEGDQDEVVVERVRRV